MRVGSVVGVRVRAVWLVAAARSHEAERARGTAQSSSAYPLVVRAATRVRCAYSYSINVIVACGVERRMCGRIPR